MEVVKSLKDVEVSGWVFLKGFDCQNVRPCEFSWGGIKAPWCGSWVLGNMLRGYHSFSSKCTSLVNNVWILVLENQRQFKRKSPFSSLAFLLHVETSFPPALPSYAFLELKSTRANPVLFITWGGVAWQALK